MKVTYYLKRPKAKVPTAIYARIYWCGLEDKYYVPDCSIHPKDWNPNTKEARKTLEGYGAFNDVLKTTAKIIIGVINKYRAENEMQPPSPEQLRELLDNRLKPEKKISFVQYLEQYIAECKSGRIKHKKTKKPLKPGTIKHYETTLTNVKLYLNDTGKKFDFGNINPDSLQDFANYMERTRKQALNTVAKYTKVFTTILNHATDKGVNTNLAYQKDEFSSATEDADTIYLPEWEIQKLEALELDKPHLQTTRDLFLIGCYTGLRWSDYSRLRPEHIKGDYITIQQEKTGNSVVIPMHDGIQKILDRYNGTLPKSFTNQKSNQYLKDICKEVDCLKVEIKVTKTKGGEREGKVLQKYQRVTTHTARRSFATNEYLQGTPTVTIMAITGHKTEASFMKYIRATSKEHAQILMDLRKRREQEPQKTIAI